MSVARRLGTALSRTQAGALVFVTSASVLVIEILAARLLAPYIGVSLEVFTGIVGVVLAGISVGAWLGGKRADRTDPQALVGPLMVVGGLASVASPLIVDLIGPGLSTGPVSIVLASTLAFFPPAALLSAVPPVVVKIRLASLENTGSVVGSYSAIGTAGAIFGTFTTGFVLIAAFPTRPIVAMIGSILAIVGIALWVRRRSRPIVAPVIAGLIALGSILFVFDGPCEVETAYHCVIVQVDARRPTGRVLVLDRLRNSYVDIEDPTHLEFRYIEVMADIVEKEAPEGPLDVVSIGGGGFTLPGYFQSTRPGSDNIVLEIDPTLVELGHSRLALDDRVDVMVDDARISIRDLGTNSADVVIGDAFSGASVPWHLTTVEFTRQIQRILRPGGIYTMNVIDYGARRFARSAANTLTAVFHNVALFAPPSYIDGDIGGNYVLVASSEPIETGTIERAIRSRGGTETGITGESLDRFIDGAVILTDDYAPVDQMVGRS